MSRSQDDDSTPEEHHLNIAKLQANVNVIDRSMIKRRKNLWNRLYHEARISYEPGKGISFTNMLLLLAHHKLIVDQEALVYVHITAGSLSPDLLLQFTRPRHPQ